MTEDAPGRPVVQGVCLPSLPSPVKVRHLLTNLSVPIRSRGDRTGSSGVECVVFEECRSEGHKFTVLHCTGTPVSPGNVSTTFPTTSMS